MTTHGDQQFKFIIEGLAVLAETKQIWVAYSGGVDSHVLLHLLATANEDSLNSLKAIHIDHGLHSGSTRWRQHCASVVAELGVAFTSIQVNVSDIDKLGLEAAARVARYSAFEQQLSENDVLLTAQHQQDQAETLLLQLFRGAGPKGLASMASQFQLGKTMVHRPLLGVQKRDILDYAEQHKLKWIDDPSNIETRWNRNYIRHHVLPEIEKRWPSVAKTISRSAENCAEASELLAELAQQDLLTIGADQFSDCLSISKLITLSPARCRNVIRYFIESKGLALPSSTVLQGIIDEVCFAKQDSVPMIAYADVEVRRYQDKLYFMPPLPEHNASQIIICANTADLKINDHLILRWQQTQGQGVTEELITAGLTIRFRQGGEQIQLPNQSHHKSLKHLFQQWQIPPWQRDRIPLLFSDDKLVGVVGYAIAKGAHVDSDEQGYTPISVTIQSAGFRV